MRKDRAERQQLHPGRARERDDDVEKPGANDDHLDELTAVRLTANRLSSSQLGRVEAHLENCPQCRDLVRRVVGWSNSTRDREAGPEWRGSVLRTGMLLAGRYRIQNFVARGGMGEVYEAFDEALGERIAIKTVASHYVGDTEAIAQLKAEVQLARRISHRNVCRIYDLERHRPEEGPPLFFLKMEFIEGQSLGERLKGEHHLSESEACHTCIGILEGLQAAHEAGVLHRDLKSDNVMFRTDRSGRLAPVLMDFGLASALNPNSSRVSGDHALIGSLSYMAPEQVQGDALRPATDLYAVGVILFEMLTGCLPFPAPTPALAAIKRLQEDAPRIRDIDPSLPDELDRIVARCLKRNPRDRYRSAREMLADLQPDDERGATGGNTPRARSPNTTLVDSRGNGNVHPFEQEPTPSTVATPSVHFVPRLTAQRGALVVGALLVAAAALAGTRQVLRDPPAQSTADSPASSPETRPTEQPYIVQRPEPTPPTSTDDPTLVEGRASKADIPPATFEPESATPERIDQRAVPKQTRRSALRSAKRSSASQIRSGSQSEAPTLGTLPGSTATPARQMQRTGPAAVPSGTHSPTATPQEHAQRRHACETELVCPESITSGSASSHQNANGAPASRDSHDALGERSERQ